MEPIIPTPGAKREKENSVKPVHIMRVFNLPVERLWRAWTDPISFKKWWGPYYFTCPYCKIDLKEGGRYLNCMRSSRGEDSWNTGVYREIIPLKKLVYTNSFSDERGNMILASDPGLPGSWPAESLVTIILEAAGEKTKMILTQESLPVEMLGKCRREWHQSLDKLEETLG